MHFKIFINLFNLRCNTWSCCSLIYWRLKISVWFFCSFGIWLVDYLVESLSDSLFWNWTTYFQVPAKLNFLSLFFSWFDWKLFKFQSTYSELLKFYFQKILIEKFCGSSSTYLVWIGIILLCQTSQTHSPPNTNHVRSGDKNTRVTIPFPPILFTYLHSYRRTQVETWILRRWLINY